MYNVCNSEFIIRLFAFNYTTKNEIPILLVQAYGY